MAGQRISLEGFEDALAAFLAASFQFDGEDKRPLYVGRNIFVQNMPDPSEITKTVDEATHPGGEYDETEPTLGIFTSPGPGVRSGVGTQGKHEWNLRLVLRRGVVTETAKERLEELVKFILREGSGRRIGGFQSKAAILQARPIGFRTAEDESAYAESTVRFLAVPLPT